MDIDERLARDQDLTEALHRTEKLIERHIELGMAVRRRHRQPRRFMETLIELSEIKETLQREIDALDVEGHFYLNP